MEFEAIKWKQAHAPICSNKFGARLFLVLGDFLGKDLEWIIAGFKQTIPGYLKEWVLATKEEDIQLAVTEYLYTAGLIGAKSVT